MASRIAEATVLPSNPSSVPSPCSPGCLCSSTKMFSSSQLSHPFHISSKKTQLLLTEKLKPLVKLLAQLSLMPLANQHQGPSDGARQEKAWVRTLESSRRKLYQHFCKLISNFSHVLILSVCFTRTGGPKDLFHQLTYILKFLLSLKNKQNQNPP